MPDRPIKLKNWDRAWRLLGDHLQCPQCGQTQLASKAYTPFSHRDDCAARTEQDQYPWLDLDAILRSVLKDY